LIVGHTHEDIDQRFSYISSALKRQDIDSLEEMLQIIRERPTFTEPFIHAEHLEHIRDWKSFITPYLREDAFVGISKPHHFRFYMQDNKPHVQYKDYARSLLWIPENGHICLDEVPNVRLQIPLAPIAEPDERELRALNDFILLKERHIARYMDIEKNLLAIEAIERFISYLKDFPLQNHFEAASAPFWPLLENLPTIHCPVPQEVQPLDSQVMDILQSLPLVMETSYFGPRSQMPRGHRIRGSSNNVRGQGRRREGNVEHMDEQINSGQTNERQGSQGREQGGRVRGGRGRGRSER
jgi:hypothetical protein